MNRLAFILSLCSVAAMGVVFLITDNLLLAVIILLAGVALAIYLDKKLAADQAFEAVNLLDQKNKEAALKELAVFRNYRRLVDQSHRGMLADAVDNIFDIANHILTDKQVDIKFVNQIGMYLPRINKVLETFLSKHADEEFKRQSRVFLIQTSEVFSRLLTASGNSDVKEAEALMEALEETYRAHGHLKQNDRGSIR